MKNWFKEAFFSFLAFCLFACFIGAAIALGILLVPLIILYLFAVVVREAVRWKKKTVRTQRQPSALKNQEEKSVVITMLSGRRAA